MKMHDGAKLLDRHQHGYEQGRRGPGMSRVGAGPSLRQAMEAGPVRAHRAIRAERGELADGRPGLDSLGLELEGWAGRGSAVDLPAANSLGLELEGRERRVGMPPDLQPLELTPAASPVQAKLEAASQAREPGSAPIGAENTREVAARGVPGRGDALPHLDRILGAFGDHDVRAVQAHIGGPAADASRAIGAAAYATGERVAFAGTPDLRTAAHEAAHVVQQRAGVSLPGGMGQAGDAYEQHADAVADRVVRGESAADLLDLPGSSSNAAQAMPAVQRRSLPGPSPSAAPGAAPATASPTPAASSPTTEGSADASADDEAAIEAAGQAALADEVETLLSRPDPVAGIGTPQDALRVLAGLPMGKLLGTLDILEQRGRLSELVSFVDGGDADPAGRIRTALLTRELASMSPAAAEGAPLTTLAAAVERMPADEQYGVYRYITARRQPSLDLEMLLEGAMAMQSALVEQSEPVPDATTGTGATGAMAGTAMPAPIEPLPWTPPGKQPAPLYRGNAAHRAIAQHYADKHKGDIVISNFTPVASILDVLEQQGHAVDRSRLTEQELNRRPDILNITRLCLYEIKPEGAAGAGQSQAALYTSILSKGGVAAALGPPNDPGTAGQLPAPGGVIIFRCVQPGVIEYQYRQGRLVPVPIPVPGDARKRAPERSWSWELQPLTPAQQSVLATAAVGTALLILAMILLAPAGI